MKKIALFIMCIVSITVFAVQNDVMLTPASKLIPGGESVNVIVSCENASRYTGFNIDLVLPEGLALEQISYFDEDEEEWMTKIVDKPTTNALKSTHTLAASYGIVGDRILRIACISVENASFKTSNNNLCYFKVVASAFAKAGVQDIQIVATDFGSYDAVAGTTTPYHFDDAIDQHITVSDQSSVTLNISFDNKWSTCILPFDYTPEGFTAYSASETSTDGGITYVNLTEASTMEAYKPYIVYAETGFSNTLSGTVNPANYPDGQNGLVENGLLKGTILRTTINSGFVLQNQGDGAMFHNVNGQTFSIPAGKCWLEAPAANAAQRIIMTTNEATALENVSAETVSSAIYTITGQQVAEPIPGNVYIHNGKKVLIIK